MKRPILLLLALSILLWLPGCCFLSSRSDSIPSGVSESTEAATEETEATVPPTEIAVQPTVVPEIDREYYLGLYADIIKDYETVVRYRFSQSFYQDWDFDMGVPGLSNVLKNAIYEANLDGSWANMVFELPDSQAAQSKDYYGYILHDLNADGVPELFWVQRDHNLAAVFTWYNDHPVLLDCYWSRYQGYVSQNNTLYTKGSSGAASNSCEIYTISGGKLQASRGFYSEIPWGSDTVKYYEVTGSGETEISSARYEELFAMYPSCVSQYWLTQTILPLEVGDLSESNVPYTQKIKRPDQSIWSGPGYEYRYVGTVEIAGTYTIVEEATDSEGNLWGKLKSGVGWVDLTQIRSDTGDPPILSAKFADSQLLVGGNYIHCIEDTSEYMVQVAFRIDQAVTDLSLCEVIFDEYGEKAVEFYHLSSWDSSKPIVADVDFPGDMSTYQISFTDSSGTRYAYQIYTSGKDGSLVLSPAAS